MFLTHSVKNLKSESRRTDNVQILSFTLTSANYSNYQILTKFTTCINLLTNSLHSSIRKAPIGIGASFYWSTIMRDSDKTASVFVPSLSEARHGNRLAYCTVSNTILL